jgi:hypothetical protein
MSDIDRLVIGGFLCLLLGISYVAAVAVLARSLLLPATAGYVLLAGLLLVRVLTGKEND